MRLIILLILFACYGPVPAQPVRKVKITELDSVIRNSDHPLLVNFWATWCLPCIEELPYFETVADSFKKDGLELLLVSLDMKDGYPSRIDSFIRRRKVHSRVVWLDENNADYFCPIIDSAWSGSIPASLFVNRQKGFRRFYEQQLTRDKLVNTLREMLDLPVGVGLFIQLPEQVEKMGAGGKAEDGKD